MSDLQVAPRPISAQWDVLIIGSGASGLYAALCLPPHLKVGLITKGTLEMGSSSWAQGGIAAAIDTSDTPHLHWQDTLKAGAGLCDPEAVKFLVEQGAKAIEALLQLGVQFDRNGQTLAMTLEAAHSRPRVLHSADTTGRAITDTLIAQVLERKNIQIFSRALALNLWLNSVTGRCQGVSLLYEGCIRWVQAGAVVLATGGGGQVFSQTTNPTVSTGDGIALAWRSGAVIRDLEFFQFHPTALMIPGAPHFLITEAVRGEGAHLVDAQGRRFAFDYHPQGELAPRDVVSRAIFSHLECLKPDPYCVYLDLRSIQPDKIRYRFPNILHFCQEFGIDILTQLIPVAPAAHYWMGGVATNLASETSLPGLYAVGEVASTGVHGANRLASNSLLECIVFAAQLADLDLSLVPQTPQDDPLSHPLDSLDRVDYLDQNQPFDSTFISPDWHQEVEQIQAIRQNLPHLMWRSAGICRSQALLEEAIGQVNYWRSTLEQLEVMQWVLNLTPQETVTLPSQAAQANLTLATETWNLTDIAHLILKSAVWRQESRGGHYRSDYPDPSEDWQCHTLIQGHHWHRSVEIQRERS